MDVQAELLPEGRQFCLRRPGKIALVGKSLAVYSFIPYVYTHNTRGTKLCCAQYIFVLAR